MYHVLNKSSEKCVCELHYSQKDVSFFPEIQVIGFFLIPGAFCVKDGDKNIKDNMISIIFKTN